MALLRDQGIDPEVFLYLETPPSAEAIESVLNSLSREPREVMRKGEAVYNELNLDDPELEREVLISAMVQHPILIERPIVINGQQAAIGRPPESVLDII
jgi:arsenate reductase